MWYYECMKENKYYQMNAMKLAYVGDAVFSLAVRKHFVANTQKKPSELNKIVNSIVCARNQAMLLKNLVDDLDEFERDIMLRARNFHVNNKAKNSSFEEYSLATQYEALIGFWYLTEQTKKLEKYINIAVEVK